LANQGRVEAGMAPLNSTDPTEAQQALYSMPASDYHDITSGTNDGYTASSGYNLVTGLGTPVADQLISDLIAYTGTASTNTVVAMQALPAGYIPATGTFGAANALTVFNFEVVGASGRGLVGTLAKTSDSVFSGAPTAPALSPSQAQQSTSLA